ncbi:glycosyltransferase [Georgenia sp. Z1491]|uniref:glycosyltransferase n=1 Tax=Georgenia sp. Z1491 TaxID=3416707 RepID=UPI003CF1B11F
MKGHTVPAASVIVPAHDEERSIGRLLTGLTASADGRRLEVVVVCNGCTDATAERAADFPGVTVVEIPQPSKHLAMRAGSEVASVYPRVYVDADVEIGADAVLRLADAVRTGPLLARAPGRRVPLDGVGLLARSYYEVWQELPQVREGLFGRGVIALSEEGHRRYAELPPAMSDDLVISELCAPHERGVDESVTVVVRPPRTVRDLLRRRIRVRTGNAQADAGRLRRADSRTRPAELLRLVRRRPALAPRVPVFVAVTGLAAWRARAAVRRGDFNTWLRDESSRA